MIHFGLFYEKDIYFKKRELAYKLNEYDHENWIKFEANLQKELSITAWRIHGLGTGGSKGCRSP